MELNVGKLHKAFRDLSLPAVEAALKGVSLHDSETAKKFVVTLRQSGCLVIEIESAAKEGARDLLIERCKELIQDAPDESTQQDLEHHIACARCVEFGYREIFKTIHRSEIWKRSVGEQAWAIIRHSERGYITVISDIEKDVKDIAARKDAIFDPSVYGISREDGSTIGPDAVFNGIVTCVSDALTTLAYAHGMFDKATGDLILPNKIEVDESAIEEAFIYFLAASQWRRLKEGWDRSRLFGAAVRMRDETISTGEGVSKNFRVLEASMAEDSELMDQIAMERVGQALLQTRMEIESSSADTPAAPTASSRPHMDVQNLERATFEVLDGHYHLPVGDTSPEVGGLPLYFWVKGYSYYTKIAAECLSQPAFSCPLLDGDQLEEGLLSSGLSREQAKKFILLTTFGRGVADLYDAPLLRLDGNRYAFFAVAYNSPVIGSVALSRISWLNRRRDEDGNIANDCVFEDKGKHFEKRVLKSFEKVGLVAKGFKYKLDGKEWDCDAAVIIDDVLFIFECKNRSIPMGHLPSLHYFLLGLDEAKGQVQRIAKQFSAHPEVVKSQFEGEVCWKRIVPVVLHALPWSSGCLDGVYFYDASALFHLLHTGFTSVIAQSKVGGHLVHRRHRYQLRKGPTPTADELEREMAEPNQLKLHRTGWYQESRAIPISEDVLLAVPDWARREVSLKERLVALGSSPQEAARVVREMPETIEMIREIGEKSKEVPSVGRNSLCPCGSGRKFKKCCLKL